MIDNPHLYDHKFYNKRDGVTVGCVAFYVCIVTLQLHAIALEIKEKLVGCEPQFLENWSINYGCEIVERIAIEKLELESDEAWDLFYSRTEQQEGEEIFHDTSIVGALAAIDKLLAMEVPA